jgi:hypothetical protein
MFFRRRLPHQFNFEERIANLKEFHFETKRDAPGRVRVTRNGCGAVIEDAGGGKVTIGKAGVLIGDETGMLVSRGYQMFLRTPSGREIPALAKHLHALHDFDEDLREGLGLTSLYNLSLGTTSDEHLYDRVVDRATKARIRGRGKRRLRASHSYKIIFNRFSGRKGPARSIDSKSVASARLNGVVKLSSSGMHRR